MFFIISVAQLCLTLRPQGLQHARLPCPSPTPGACSNSCPSSPGQYTSLCPELLPGVRAWRSCSGKRGASLAENTKIYWTRHFSLALCPQQEGYVGSGTEGWVDGVAPLSSFTVTHWAPLCFLSPEIWAFQR